MSLEVGGKLIGVVSAAYHGFGAFILGLNLLAYVMSSSEDRTIDTEDYGYGCSNFSYLFGV